MEYSPNVRFCELIINGEYMGVYAYSEKYATENGIQFRCGLYPLDKKNIPSETAVYNARQGYLSATNEKQAVYLCNQKDLDRVSLKSRLQKKISTALEKEEFQIYL